MNKKKPEIIFITLAYVPLIGGAEKQTQAIAERLVNNGYRVSVLTRWHSGLLKEELINNVRVLRIRTIWLPFFSWLSYVIGVLQFVWQNRKENLILQAQMLSIPAIAAALVGTIFKKPTLVKLTSGGLGGNIDTLLKSHLGKLKFNFLKNNIDYFIAINVEIKKELLQHGVITRKIKLIPNGVDTDIYFPADDLEKIKLKQELNLKCKNLVLFVGRLNKIKNLDILIKSFAEIVPLIPDVSLVIVGSGPEENNLKQLVQRNNLTEKVIFKSHTQNVLPYFKASDIFILPSGREGLSNALLEAMACGLAPVVSNVGGNKDLVIDGENGLVVEPGDTEALKDALKLLLQNNEWRLKLAQEARETIKRNYELKIIIQLYLNLYEIMTKKNYKKHFPILVYHRVQEKPEFGMDINTSSFEKQMYWLYNHSWQTISLDKIIECLDKDIDFPKKSFVITFDDGHRDNYEQAFPALKKLGFSALIFLTYDYIGTTQYTIKTETEVRQWFTQRPDDWQGEDTIKFRKFEFLTWEQIKEMQNYEIEFGAHTLTHSHLSSLPQNKQEEEIRKSKELLQEKLNTKIEHFCYPYQDFNQEIKEQVRTAGFKSACYSPSHYDLLFYWDDLYALERISIFGNISLWKFKMLITGKYFRVRKYSGNFIWNKLTYFYRIFK